MGKIESESDGREAQLVTVRTIYIHKCEVQ